jgi:hypothetical protein
MRKLAWLLAAAGAFGAPRKLSPLAQNEAYQAYVVEFQDAAAAMRASMLAPVIDHPDLLPKHVIVQGDLAAAANLSELDEVAHVFPASPELIDGERVNACEGALIDGPVAEAFTKFGQGWPPAGKSVSVAFHLANGVADLPLDRVLGEVTRALGEWMRHANLRFEAAVDPQASHTIAIRFARGAHGDAYPLDGRGRVLAHTFYPAPPNPESLAGDMHLDADETWGIGENTDIFTVVLHELGHALGLGHSDRPGAVMYPYYRSAVVGLSSDDIEGIQALYGKRVEAAAPETPVLPVPPASPGPPVSPVPPLRITLASPTGPLTTDASEVSLRGTSSGGTPPVTVGWRSDRGPAGPAVGSVDWRIDNIPLKDGVNLLTVTAIDASGASAAAAVTVTKAGLAPSPPSKPAPVQTPTLRITYPNLTIMATSAASITLRGISGGASRVAWRSSSGFSGDASGLANWTAEVPLYIGTNTVTVRAYSESGAQVWRAVTVVRR